MPVDCIPFRDTNYFSSFICDYLDQNVDLQSLYGRFPELDNFKDQIEEKQASFSMQHREILMKALQNQYGQAKASDKTIENISLLKKGNTFTVVTGHQLNLFTGPLYFLYKIVSTINLTRTLKEKYPDFHFVPVYWMATEDHDFEEINYFNLYGKKVQWNRSDGGAVGEFDTIGLDKVFEAFASQIGVSQNAERLKLLFEQTYIQYDNLADATRYLANELFGEYGLVIVDGNDKELKRLFVPYVKQELSQKTTYSNVLSKVEEIEDLGYKAQVNPREINLFYITKGLRERIVERDGSYFVNNTEISWSNDELLEHLNEAPERFSPNVLMRPLYQEVILPNLCYIGGGGELAYWLELKESFKAFEVPFPMLLLRNSVLIETKKQAEKLKKLEISDSELFLKQHELINHKVRKISNIEIDFTLQREHLKKQFVEMYQLAKQTDVTFYGAVKSQEIKQLKGLDMLEKRLLKAQKRKLRDHVQRMIDLQNDLFPNQSLQERNKNFSEIYLEYGENLIPTLIKSLNPLQQEFVILKF